MEYLIIGSHAYNVELINRNMQGRIKRPNDVDVICNNESFEAFVSENNIETYSEKGCKRVLRHKNVIHEFELIENNQTLHMLFELVSDNHNLVNVANNNLSKSFPGSVSFAGLDLQYSLKMSHRFLKNSPHFLKTMRTIKNLRMLGAVQSSVLSEFYTARVKDTYYYKHPKLNTDKDSFFDTKGVTYKYDHDSIHTAIAILDKPAYNYFKPDESEVFCSKELFNDLPERTKLLAVLEESCVLALERGIVPYGFSDNSRDVFVYALKKVCTSITSGWFRSFAWENYHNVLSLYDSFEKDFYYNDFTKGVSSGVVIKHKEKT